MNQNKTPILAFSALTACGLLTAAYAENGTTQTAADLLQQADRAGIAVVSPVQRIDRQQPPPPPPPPADPQVRSIDGSNNNPNIPDMNAADTQLFRYMAVGYSDQVSTLAGQYRPGPRVVSNAVNRQTASIPNPVGASDFLWQWGQFLDHDIDLTDGMDPPEYANIAIPAGDPFFDPSGSGTQTLSFNRSYYDIDTGTGSTNPRQQINEISGWIDASNVYGSDTERAAALRTNDGTGRLKTSDGDLLPFNTTGLPNAGGDSSSLFLAGDVRANEQVGLTAMHTLFMREHNLRAAEIAEQDPSLTGEQIYQTARRQVGALMQAITYKEFLPVLLGPNALRPYKGYDPAADARIMNEFSTGAYRLGHSLLSPTLMRLDPNGNAIPAGHLALRNAFFAPYRITDEGGIEPILRGLANQICQNLDVFVIDDVRNFLFGNPGEGGFDLASLNIQRGRDHGLPSYNQARRAMGLPPARSFADVSSNPQIRARLASVYTSAEDMDMWVGGLAENHMPGALVGELFFTLMKKQFEALRDGDRFWYQRTLTPEELQGVENTTLADIIRRNTRIGREIPDDVFHVRQNPPPPQG